MLQETIEQMEARAMAMMDELEIQMEMQGLQQDEDQFAVHSSAISRDPTLALLLPLLILLSTLLFLLIFFLVFIIVLKRKRRQGIALQDDNGPLDLAREEELEGEGGLVGVEQRWLEQQDDNTKVGYDRAKSELDHWNFQPRSRLMT